METTRNDERRERAGDPAALVRTMGRAVVGSAHFGPGAVTLHKAGREVARLPFALETGVAALRAALAEHFGPSATLTGYYPRAAVVVPAEVAS